MIGLIFPTDKQTQHPRKEGCVLTKSHLAVLRAALQYFEDELCSHGMDVMRPYFDEEPANAWTSEEIRGLMAFLRDCELRYAAYSPADDQLTGVALSLPEHGIPSVPNPTWQVVTVVLPPQA